SSQGLSLPTNSVDFPNGVLMRSRKRMAGLAALAVSAVAAVAVPNVNGVAAQASARSRPAGLGPASGMAGTTRVVTLVTGDRVTVTVDGTKTSLAGVTAGNGRSRI